MYSQSAGAETTKRDIENKKTGITSDPLIKYLLHDNKLREHELYRVLDLPHYQNDSLALTLVRLGLVSDADMAQALSGVTGLEVLSANAFPQDFPPPEQLSLRFIQAIHAVVIGQVGDELVLAMADPRDFVSIDAVAMACCTKVQVRLAQLAHIDQAIERYYAHASEKNSQVDQQLDKHQSAEITDDVEHLRDLASEAPVIRAVNTLLQRAVEQSASDIHIEPLVDRLRVRYRIDGVLHQVEGQPTASGAAVISRIKIMAHMDIAERRLPQDGRIQQKILGREIDLRVSTIPTLYGESAVIRLLDKDRIDLQLDALGFDALIKQNFVSLLERAHGIVLVTGPTGSGKTTTLYAGLQGLNSLERKIITVEDPVEYQLAGINQIQVKQQIGLTFATALRAIVRQDPDVILIGEMRDLETARIAVQSALTGHLVLSTLHTNDAAGAITRLQDMGLENYLLTSTINGILAQRLVRVLCNHCRQAYQLSSGAAQGMGVSARPQEDVTLYHATGCEHCKGSGYNGRIALLECLEMNEEIRSLVLTRADATTIQRAAIKGGMRTMFQHGVALARQGITTMEEVLRVTQEF